jgi:UDP-N-acetylglucosamine--N-acetylmuramyl-(pentapeptide) pyrophosphoryl-undecaprenol N-acetylglucosamine transferase
MLTSHSLLFVGSVGGMERALVARAGLPFAAIHGGGVHGVGWRLPLNAFRLLRGLLGALRLVRAHRPQALLVTGGFITVPAALAAWLSRVPVLVYLPDIEPALAVKAISRLARRIAVTVSASRRYFPGRAGDVLVTGYPVRSELLALAQDPGARAAARRHFERDPERPVVLVTGGSRGARSLNRAVAAALPGWLGDYAVIHLSGELDWPEVERARAALPAAARAHYHAFPFLHEMGLALAAADLVVSRAGASALGEYPLFGLPAILVPYPHAWRYQRVNAQALVERGAAVQINDDELPARLAGEVRALLADPARLAAMRAAARAAATPDAAAHIARALLQLAGAAQDETLP